MHEVSIACTILDIVKDQCKEAGYTKIESISLHMGRGAGVVKDALVFAFDAVKKGTSAQEAILIVEEIPFSGYCHNCENDFISEQEGYVFFCPLCGSFEFTLHSGKELNIVEMEVT
jgi:hydrogenase nickel incorporation protein HypA/HybF